MRESPPTLDRAGILARIPHQGASCLLDRVCFWDVHTIVCETQSHLLADHPYRLNGRLSAVCAVEYAAQAIALHIELKFPQPNGAQRPGYLAAVRELRLSTATLNTCPGTLTIAAEELVTEARALLYAFSVRHQDSVIAQGCAAVSLQTTLQ